jgi:aryl-alcohol dehydrogenase-like predicted oxidoreductase
MIYKKLGNTDIEVSLVGLGTMTWGEQNTEAEACEQMDYAVAKGINLIDVAEMYPVPARAETSGRTESYVGEWLRQTGKRNEIVLASKVSGPSSVLGVNHIRGGSRLSADQVRRAIEGSLERLQTDYLDLYQVHWPERMTNYFGQRGYIHQPDLDGVAIEETLVALAELVDEGLVKHIGISNETPWGVMEYLRLARERDLPRIVGIQNPYSLLTRQFETGLAEMSFREGVGLLAYSPLGFGVLSGKYLNNAMPAGSRIDLFPRFARYSGPIAQAATQAYLDVAAKHGLSLVELSLAFVCQQPFVASCLIGATTMAQLKQNIDACQVVLSDAVKADLNEVYQRYPDPAP